MVRYIMTRVPRLISYPAPEVEEELQFHNRWLEVFGEYSARQLTVSTDKAIAIAGVASIVQENTGLPTPLGYGRRCFFSTCSGSPQATQDPDPPAARRGKQSMEFTPRS